MANEREKSLFQTPAMMDQERMVEAILFASKEPVKIQDFLNRMPHGCEPILALNNLKVFYQTRGVNLKKIGDAWAIRTAPDLGFLMQSESVEMRKLSRAAVETLSIIAYHQPVSRGQPSGLQTPTVPLKITNEIDFGPIWGPFKVPRQRCGPMGCAFGHRSSSVRRTGTI